MSNAGSFQWTAQELATKLGATLRGPGDVVLNRLETLDRADSACLTFIRDARNASRWSTSNAGAALLSRVVANDPAANPADETGRALIVVDDADRALIRVLEWLSPEAERSAAGIHKSAHVHPSAMVAASATIGPGCVVGEDAVIHERVVLRANVSVGDAVNIGADSVIHAGAVIYPRSTIGARCTLHANVVIGADGFGYRPRDDGRGLVKIPHIGIVEIHDDVEIGAGTTIDRAKFGATIIGAGTKIDNLVQIGHNVRIGRACIICGCTAIAGSTVLGDGVTLAGGVGLADNLTIGAGAKIGARSGVMEDIPAGEMWVGYPAKPARHTLRTIAALQQLPDVMAQVKKLLRDT